MYRFYSKDTDRVDNRLTTPGYNTPESLNVYYNKYKNLEKELQHGGEEGYSASTAYLSKVKSFKMIPSPLGLIHYKGTETCIKANNLKMGENYAQALSSSMKHLSNT
jgi:hypothetical protein